MHRYFEDADLLARDRPLFARYLPVFDALNRAGWEPVTHARADAPQIRVERFGAGKGALLAVANTSSEERQAVLTLDRAGWGAAPLTFRSLLTEGTVQANVTASGLVLKLTIAPHRTAVLQPQDL